MLVDVEEVVALYSHVHRHGRLGTCGFRCSNDGCEPALQNMDDMVVEHQPVKVSSKCYPPASDFRAPGSANLLPAPSSCLQMVRVTSKVLDDAHLHLQAGCMVDTQLEMGLLVPQ